LKFIDERNLVKKEAKVAKKRTAKKVQVERKKKST